MKKNRKKITSYDDLIAGYYGYQHHHDKQHHKHSHQHQQDQPKHPHKHKHYHNDQQGYGGDKNKHVPGELVLSKSFDNGEILEQIKDGSPATGYEEYVMQSSVSPEFEEYVLECADSTFEEYVVNEESTVSTASSVPAEINIPGIPHINLPEEYKTDILDPLGLSNRGNAPSYGGPAYGNAGFGGAGYDMPYNNPGISDRNDPFAMSAAADVPLAEEIPETPKSKMSEDDLFSDMQAILTGAKVFDPLTKKTVSKDQLGKAASKEMPPPRQQPAADGPPLPKSSEHAIFDKIAQSMQYANAYDLGSIDLDNRFSDFDRISDYKDKEATDKKNQPVSKDMDQEIKAGHAEFIQDLDAIRKDQQEKAGSDNANTEINTVIN